MNTSIVPAVLLFIALLTAGSSVVINAEYVDLVLTVTSVSIGNVGLTVLDAKGIGATYTNSGGVNVSVYSGYYVYDNSTNYNDTLIIETNSSLDAINYLHLYSTFYSQIRPGEIDVSPLNDYVAVVGSGTNASSGDSDGYIVISDLSLNSSKTHISIFDGVSSQLNYTIFTNVFYSSNDHIYVVGGVYDEANGYYDGLIVVYSFNGSSIILKQNQTYTYNDPDGYSNNLLFMKGVIGPDGYLYVTGYIPYYYSGYGYYAYKAAIVKIDPLTLQVISANIYTLYNSQGYIGTAWFTGSVTSDDNYIYVTFNKLSDYSSSSNTYTRASLIMCLDTSLNLQWGYLWDTKEYNEFLFDIAVTDENLTVVGGTDNNYGSTSFSQMNDIMLSIDPASGSPKYGVLVGGTGYEYFKDPAIDYEGKLYAIGRSDTQSFNELYIPGSSLNFSVSNAAPAETGGISTATHNKSITLKPVNTPLPDSPLYRSMLKSLLEHPPKPSKGSSLRPGIGKAGSGHQKKPVIRSRGIEFETGSLKLSQITVEQNGTPGHVVKFAPYAGQVSTAPPPVPESYFAIITGAAIGVAAALLLYRRKAR